MDKISASIPNSLKSWITNVASCKDLIFQRKSVVFPEPREYKEKQLNLFFHYYKSSTFGVHEGNGS